MLITSEGYFIFIVVDELGNSSFYNFQIYIVRRTYIVNKSFTSAFMLGISWRHAVSPTALLRTTFKPLRILNYA